MTGQLQKLASNNLPQVEKISKIKSNGALDSTALQEKHQDGEIYVPSLRGRSVIMFALDIPGPRSNKLIIAFF
jgi:hypothetical protein